MAKKKKKKSKTKRSKSVPKSSPKSSGKRSPKASSRDEEYMTVDERSDSERDEYESAVSHLSSVTAESAELPEPFEVDLDVLEGEPPGIPWRLPQKRFRTV